MASIRARATTWQVRWRQDGQSQTETFGRESDAVRFRERVEDAGSRWPAGWVPGKGDVEGAGSVNVAARGTTVRELVASWMSDGSEMLPHVRDVAEGALRRRFTVGNIADMSIADVTQAQIQEWADALSKEYKPGTVRVTLVWLSAAFTQAHNRGLVQRSPVYDIRYGNERRARIKPVFLSEAEESRLRAAVAPEYALYVRFMLETGLRYGESWALYPHSLTQANGVVSVEVSQSRRREGSKSVLGETKTKEIRTVTLPTELGADMVAFAATRDPGAPLFDLPNSGDAFRYSVWAPACAAARLTANRRPRIHDMRHTHASRMLAMGMTITALSKRLGHASVKTTQDIYAHLEREDKASQLILDTAYTTPKPQLRAV